MVHTENTPDSSTDGSDRDPRSDHVGFWVHERESVSEAVVRALATVERVEPTELDCPLYERLDPDALNAVFAPRLDGTARPSDGSLVFSICRRDVIVRADGRVLVGPVG